MAVGCYFSDARTNGEFMLKAAQGILGIFAIASFLPAAAQDKSALRPVRMVMASTKLPVTAGAPLHFRLLNVSIPAGKSASFAGSGGFVYVAGGKLELTAGTEKIALAEGEAKFIAAGAQATLRSSGRKPASLLHYLLAPVAALDEKAYSGATVAELYRAREPAPLSAGPHEFSLTRVTSPAGAPAPPMHHRSGAALYRVLSGTATLHIQGRDEPRATGAVQYEPNGFIHTWENTGKVPLVLLQANISAEGAPEIIWLK
jgi:mannose-6-phosphate isomerase-like protein (cupin superfamily)